jgi:prepilin-type N-terminal cleavage/methylation domain-containing protein
MRNKEIGGSLRSKKGFSLIELLVVTVTVGIISAVIAPVFLSGFQAFFWARSLAGVNSQGELAMDRMVRELRGLDPAGTSWDTSQLPDATQIKFNQYYGTPQATWITYSRQGSNLMRNADILASNVTSVGFSYFKADGSALASPLTLARANSIWLIRIVLQMSGGQATESLQTTVFLRRGAISR